MLLKFYVDYIYNGLKGSPNSISVKSSLSIGSKEFRKLESFPSRTLYIGFAFEIMCVLDNPFLIARTLAIVSPITTSSKVTRRDLNLNNW